MAQRIDVGIFGGSGFYELLEGAEQVAVDTPYGEPSAPIVVGEIGGRPVGFLPRHGLKHEHPPHAINYRANVWAMRMLGVRRLVSASAVGRFVIRAMTAPAMALTSRLGPNDSPAVKPREGRTRMAVKADTIPASITPPAAANNTANST